MADSSETSPPESDRPTVPTSGVLLGLDFGTKRLGLAVSTFDQSIASPLANYDRQGEQADSRYLTKITTEYRVVGLVVGLPVHMSGDEGGKAREARQFGTWATSVTGLPVTYWDERHTSSIAEARLMSADLTKKKRKARLDKVAAQIMLQSFLDAPDRSRPPGALDS